MKSEYNDMNNNSFTKNYDRWRNCEGYYNEKRFTNAVKLWIDFYEGRQWGNIRAEDEDLPRPVLNMCKLIVDNKKSNILGSPVKLNYKSDIEEMALTKFNKFADYQLRDMKIEELDNDACFDGLVKGTYCYHFYMDDKSIGLKGKYEGALRGEIVDFRNIGVANPCLRDIQKQKWVIIRSREELDAVRDGCENEAMKKKIIADKYVNQEINEIEQEGTDLVTVFTRYFRKDGEVYYEKSTRDVDFCKPTPLNPKLLRGKTKKSMEEDTEINTSPDEKVELENDVEYTKKQLKANLYPIELSCLTKRDSCIFGISEVEAIMPNQKAVNFNMAMVLLNAQDMGMSKWLVKEGALGDQKITNEGGQMIVDHSIGSGWGITRVQGDQVNNGMVELSNALINMTRELTGASEIFTGANISKDLSGTAIAQLQAQAQKPIDAMQKAFWRSKERIGKILEMFFKLYFNDYSFTYQLNDRELTEAQNMSDAISDGQGTNRVKVRNFAKDKFNGREYAEYDFNVVVEAGQGTRYSELASVEMMNSLFLNGAINNMTPENLEIFMKLMPETIFPQKAEMMDVVEKQKQEENAQLKQQNQELAEMITQLQQVIKQQEGEANYLKQYLQGFKKQYANDMSIKNEQLKIMQKYVNDNENAKQKDDKTNTN